MVIDPVDIWESSDSRIGGRCESFYNGRFGCSLSAGHTCPHAYIEECDESRSEEIVLIWDDNRETDQEVSDGC